MEKIEQIKDQIFAEEIQRSNRQKEQALEMKRAMEERHKILIGENYQATEQSTSI